jgi:hypothetical protein
LKRTKEKTMSSNEVRSSGIVRPIVKSDTVDIPTVAGLSLRAVCCGSPGTITFLDATNTTITNFPVQAGYNPIKPVRILDAGTASDLWALY